MAKEKWFWKSDWIVSQLLTRNLLIYYQHLIILTESMRFCKIKVPFHIKSQFFFTIVCLMKASTLLKELLKKWLHFKQNDFFQFLWHAITPSTYHESNNWQNHMGRLHETMNTGTEKWDNIHVHVYILSRHCQSCCINCKKCIL